MQRLLFDDGPCAPGSTADICTGRVGPIRYASTPASHELIEAVLTELLASAAAEAATPPEANEAADR